MNDYINIKNEIDNLIEDITVLKHKKDNTKYENISYDSIISDLDDMKAFILSQEFKQELKKAETKEMTIDEMGKELSKNIEELKGND